MLEKQGTFPSAGEARFRIVRVHGLDRFLAFQLSQENFAAAFNAQIADDTEEFYSVIDRSGSRVAAFGLNRCAERMSSGKYIADQNVSTAVHRHLSDLTSNARLVELCHLGLTSGRVFCQLLPQLASFLAQRADVLICTATSQLARHFIQRGFAPHRLAQAHITQLPNDEQNHWGTYYTTNPQVLAGRLMPADQLGGSLHVA